MGREELIRRYNVGERDFVGINLSGVDLQGIDLARINLFEANLKGTNLAKTNLAGAYLFGANLFEADLTKANLTKAYLLGTDLTKAVLTKANLFEANLLRTDLTKANLTKANLTKSNLSRANLSETNLQGTCLDPQAPIPETDLSCFETDRDYIIGYRTEESQHNGYTIYKPGEHYVAPCFSVCTKTSCHPGIYLATLTWLEDKYPGIQYVKVKALKAETLKVGDKYRAKQVWVIEDV